MRRRNIIDPEVAKKSIQAHVLFVAILTLGAFFLIASEPGTDGNTVIFAMILAFGIIIALSLFNKFVVDLCNDFNDKWPVINYFIPGVLMGLILLVLRIPVDIFGVLLLVVLMSIGNLIMYYTLRQTNRNS